MLRALRRSAAAVLLALLISLVGAAPANAHATLLATDPAPGARLDSAPTEVRLTFSEPVTVVPGSVRLLRADQAPENLPAHTVDAVVVASLPELPTDTRHTVAWRVVSADGHPISGLLTFSLGNAPANAPAPATEEAAPSTWLTVSGSVTTGIWYAGLLLVAGLLAFRFICLRSIAGAPRVSGAGSTRLIAVGVAAGGLAAMTLVPLRALTLADGLPAGSAGWLTLAGWQNPLAALLTCAGLGAALVLQRRDRIGAALGCAAFALASPALTGHSAAVQPVWLMVVGDLVHLAAAAVWTGGVVGLGLYLREVRDDAGTAAGSAAVGSAATVVGRFSGLAGTTVFTAGLAGVVMALLILPGRGAVIGTGYGRLLLVKFALVGLAAAIGGWNRFRLVPAVERLPATADRWRALTRALRIEIAVLAAVVVATGFLVNLSPTGTAADHSGHAGHVHAPTPTGPTAVRGQSDRLVVTGTASPLENGTTQLEFTVTDPAGAVLHPIEPPSATAALPPQDLGPTRYEARPSPRGPDGTYLVAVETPLPGRWQILVGVRFSTFTQETVRLDLDVS